jgi:hypothetical protein
VVTPYSRTNEIRKNRCECAGQSASSNCQLTTSRYFLHIMTQTLSTSILKNVLNSHNISIEPMLSKSTPKQDGRTRDF